MGRDFSYAFITDTPRENIDDNYDFERLRFEEVCGYRNYVDWMYNAVFTKEEFIEYIESCIQLRNFQAVEALSHILNDYNFGDEEVVVIRSF